MIGSATILANMGTPLMWANMLHLVVGNALIGLLEGLLLAWLFRVRAGRAVGLMILANYASAWIGTFALGGIVPKLTIDLTNARTSYWSLVAATYVLTFVLELPLVALVFRGRPRPWRAAIRGSVVVQTVSYVLLFGWYGLATDVSLYRELRVVDASELPLPADVDVYFLGVEDGRVRTLRDGEDDSVAPAASGGSFARLFLRPSRGSGAWDLVGRVRDGPILAVRGSLAPARVGTCRGYDRADIWEHVDPTRSLDPASPAPWTLFTGHWFRANRSDTGDSVLFAYQTPFTRWWISRATLLPGDLVVLQLGARQICLLDLRTRRIALLTKGRCPVAVLADEPR